MERVNARILTPEFVGALTKHVNLWLSDTVLLESKIEAAQKHLRKLERAINNLLDMAELHPSVDLLNRLAQREQERDVEQANLDRLLKQMKLQSMQVSEDMLMTLVSDMRQTLEIGQMQARQEIIRQAVEKIEVGRDRARLHYHFPLDHIGLGDWLAPPGGTNPPTGGV